jgi:hypothetical protein
LIEPAVKRSDKRAKGGGRRGTAAAFSFRIGDPSRSVSGKSMPPCTSGGFHLPLYVQSANIIEMELLETWYVEWVSMWHQVGK